MNVEVINWNKFKNIEQAKAALIRLLQNAHAGEKAAANAYWGHTRSIFIHDSAEREHIQQIYTDELLHRTELLEMLIRLGAKPRFLREVMMYAIGVAIGFFSIWGTWFIPMYGAGKLESSNVGEYEVAARLAFLSGNLDLVDRLLHFAEVELDHEDYFRKKVLSHAGSKVFWLWAKPKDKVHIRLSMNVFIENNT